MLDYRRTGGRQPADFETLTVAKDGTFAMWRTIARASQPPTPIGRFGGSLSAEELDTLRADVQGVRRQRDLTLELPPGSAVERIAVRRRSATIPHSAQPDGPWGALVARCRSLLTALTDRPQAALALDVASDGSAATLVHLGSDALLLDSSSLAVRAILWRGDQQLGDWRWQASGDPSDVEAGPGWSMDVPFDHGLAASDTASIAAYVDVAVFAGDDEGWRRCSLQQTADLENLGLDNP